MMNGQEKSDSGIVAVKPTNKAGQPGAELAEPRPETKGNVGQQSTLRTQGRERVSQALGRVRQVRRQPPEVGATCGKAARVDLSGGRPVMGVPTAKSRSSVGNLRLPRWAKRPASSRRGGGAAIPGSPGRRGCRPRGLLGSCFILPSGL